MSDLRKGLAAFFGRQTALGFTRTEFCRKAKVSEGTVRDFLKGRTKTVQHDTLEKLAAAAGITVYDIIGYTAEVAKTAQPAQRIALALESIAESLAKLAEHDAQRLPWVQELIPNGGVGWGKNQRRGDS